jgi:hypothetical protein
MFLGGIPRTSHTRANIARLSHVYAHSIKHTMRACVGTQGMRFHLNLSYVSAKAPVARGLHAHVVVMCVACGKQNDSALTRVQA